MLSQLFALFVGPLRHVFGVFLWVGGVFEERLSDLSVLFKGALGVIQVQAEQFFSRFQCQSGGFV